ncbi:carbohydrate-binding module family 18 protein, partial [Piromyces sp. E2]
LKKPTSTINSVTSKNSIKKPTSTINSVTSKNSIKKPTSTINSVTSKNSIKKPTSTINFVTSKNSIKKPIPTITINRNNEIVIISNDFEIEDNISEDDESSKNEIDKEINGVLNNKRTEIIDNEKIKTITVILVKTTGIETTSKPTTTLFNNNSIINNDNGEIKVDDANSNDKDEELVDTSIKGKCGKGYGSCKEGYCCSQYGWCGITKEYCDIEEGCQTKFGICWQNSIKKYPTITTNEYKKQTSRMCGEGYGSCKEGYCCSKYGWCGKTDSYCSEKMGCQFKFGICKKDVNSSINKTAKETSSSSVDYRRCGNIFGSCREGYCCSMVANRSLVVVGE